MKRSPAITIALVTQVAAAALLAGCGEEHRLTEMAEGPTPAQVCADKDGVIVTDDMCKQPPPQQAQAGGSGHAPVIVQSYPYHWYYYPHYEGRTYWAPGGRIPSNAVTTPPAGVTPVRPNAPGFTSSPAYKGFVSVPKAPSAGLGRGGGGVSGGGRGGFGGGSAGG